MYIYIYIYIYMVYIYMSLVSARLVASSPRVKEVLEQVKSATPSDIRRPLFGHLTPHPDI